MEPPKDQDNKELKKEELKKEEPKKEEPKKESTSESNIIDLTNPLTGEKQQFTPYELLELAQFGLMQATKGQQADKDDKSSKDEEPEVRIQKLEKQIADMQETSKREKQASHLTQVIDKALSKYDVTKEDNKLAEKIKLLTLTQLNFNPRLNPDELVAKEVKDFMEIEQGKEERSKKSKSDNDAVKTALIGTVRGGGVPVIDKNKEFKAEDLKGNASRVALEKYLRQISSE